VAWYPSETPGDSAVPPDSEMGGHRDTAPDHEDFRETAERTRGGGAARDLAAVDIAGFRYSRSPDRRSLGRRSRRNSTPAATIVSIPGQPARRKYSTLANRARRIFSGNADTLAPAFWCVLAGGEECAGSRIDLHEFERMERSFREAIVAEGH